MLVKSYARDFKNDTEIVSHKIKEAKNVRGIVTVQLFDAETQKKVFEAKTENLITSIGKDYFRWAIQDRIIQSSSATKPSFNNVFNTIQLYTSNAAETDDLYPEFGTLIGWADQVNYSGSDTLKGTINVSESKFSYDKYMRIHFVFDWPTHSGNGTFQTLVWAFSTSLPFALPKTITGPGANLYGLAWDGSHLWVCDTITSKLHRINPDSGQIVTSFSINGYGVAWDGAYLWVNVTGERKIKKVDPGTGAILTSINTSAVRSIYDITWDGAALWAVDAAQKKIVKIDPNTGNELLIFDTPAFNGISDPRGIAWDGTRLWLSEVYGDKIYKINPANGNVLATYSSNNDSTTSGLAWDGTNLWATGFSGNTIIKLGQVLYGARTLLPTPVTKTSTNTMKIQYDFIFQD